jgi:hypothetical protein
MSDVPPKRRRTADQRLLADNQLLPPLLPPLWGKPQVDLRGQPRFQLPLLTLPARRDHGS